MRLLLLFIVVLWADSVLSQDPQKQQIIEQRIEFIGESLEDSEIDLTTYFDDLFNFYDNPLNLNNATEEQLIRLHLLSDVQVISLLNYRKLYGDFISIYELAAIDELDMNSIEMILPFVRVEKVDKDDFKWKNAIRYSRHEILVRYQNTFEEKDGYIIKPDSVLAESPNSQYLGSSDKLYLRYRNRYKDRLSWGFTAEKDAGEQFFKGTQKQGFDFYSGHLFVRKIWKLNAVALGDYQVNFGQGLTMWSGFGIGKSADVMNGKRFATGLRPYTSVNESRYLRGGAANFQNEKIDLTIFGSRKKLDANINQEDTLNGFDNSFSSFQISGFHRTPSELEKKNTLRESIVGGEFALKGDSYRIGISSVYTSYDQPLIIDTSGYKKFKFFGDQLLTTGLNYRFYVRKLTVFGETAISDNLRMGTVNGLSWHVDPRLDLLLIYRNYDKAFQSLYSTGFGESSDNTGERGLYIGAQARISKKVSINAYYDQFKFTYNKWLTNDLSHGREYFGQINYKASRNTNFYVRMRNKVTQRNTKDDVEGIKGQEYIRKNTIRVNYDQRINWQWSLKTRFEWVNHFYGDQKSKGIMFFQDIKFRFRKFPLTVYGRYAIFDTDNYDSRIYAYENDLLGLFSIPSYYNKGIRTYLMLKYDLGRKIDLWFRWDVFSYANQESISSGLEEIQGNEKTTIKLQLKIKL
ncbi:MAG: helix-hairpin-helix domain-containing protein [Crocinitomix sp.]|nr:helix-hairpin-helix domain-containing protein [Crocinitomix sp.]